MSKRRDVILALKALVRAALPNSKLRGFDTDTSKPADVGPAGTVIGYPGDPGDPEQDLSPLTYHYQHAFTLEVAPPTAAGDQAGVLDEMLGDIGAAVAADRTLGGHCTWLEASAPDEDDTSAAGTASQRWAGITITAHYSTTDPLN